MKGDFKPQMNLFLAADERGFQAADETLQAADDADSWAADKPLQAADDADFWAADEFQAADERGF